MSFELELIIPKKNISLSIKEQICLFCLTEKENGNWPADASLKKNEISLSADWVESEPWTQFFSESNPHIALMLEIKPELIIKNSNKELFNRKIMKFLLIEFKDLIL